MLRPASLRAGFSPPLDIRIDPWGSPLSWLRDWREASVSCKSAQTPETRPTASAHGNSNGYQDKMAHVAAKRALPKKETDHVAQLVFLSEGSTKAMEVEFHKRLQMMREARMKSEARLKGLQAREADKPESQDGTQSATKLVSTKKTVDRRVFDQVSASRNRLSQQLSSKNRYIRHLEGELEERTEVLANAHKAVLRVAYELDSIKRLSEVAIAAAAFGVDKAEAVARSERIIRRAVSLQEGIEKEAKMLDRLVVRRVPIAWYGVASEVKIMGDFDNWTEGFSLSPDEIQDQTFTRFRADIPLLPGSYKVKFKVDDAHWRLASEWPTVDDADGSTNNLLIVE